MKFGFFYNIHDVTKQRDYSALLDELRELAIMCDRAGFDTFWMPEHHFSVWGRELLPNPLLVAADLAARTERIRIGLGAAIITFWHPLRAAEDIALLDHLTGGRIEVGVGRGNYGLEAMNLNPIADPNNPAMNVKVFDEAVSVLKAALGQERFAFKGDIYQFPAPGFRADRAHSVDDPAYVDPETKELVKLSTFPRPRQLPLPPLWQMVNSLDSIRHAARQDMGIVMWRPGIAALRERLSVYRDAVAEHTGQALPTGARTAIMRDTFVARSEEAARALAEGPLMDSLNFSNWRGPGIFLDPGETLSAEREVQLKRHLTYDFVRDRSVYFGSPERIVAKVEELRRETNIEGVIFKSSWPGLAHDHCRESLRLLGQEVLPALRPTAARQAAE